jgi:class 3 adenylate cyclase/tetratricopeptide (TPR) repeat protein
MASAADTRESEGPGLASGTDRAAPYVPWILQRQLARDPAGQYWTADGTAVFVDISGFTKLSESLARKGREGAEHIAEAIGHVFASMLSVAYKNGASLLSFGGDALLLWFEGGEHLGRACRTAVLMRQVLIELGPIELPDTSITLKMSQGVHSATFHFFAVGNSHRELLQVDSAWSRLAAMEHAAEADEIVMSTESAMQLSDDCLGTAKGPGILLKHAPLEDAGKIPLPEQVKLAPETLAGCLSPAIRAHVLAGGGTSEHRPVTIAFIRFEGTDALIAEHGLGAAAEALNRIVSALEAAAEEQGVAFLASDVDADGGKLILTAGAPNATGNDEERMLFVLRKFVDSKPPLPVRIGVHRGAVFAGDVGPPYARTYTVMGDAVNLAARLMAKAEPGQIYATADVLERSDTLFETSELEPFAVKGKAEPVKAWSVGPAQGSRKRHVTVQKLPLTGRNAELGLIRKAYTSARSGVGRLVEVTGEAGLGKSRLLEALRDAAAGFRKLHASCEAYTASTPYAVWQELLREMMHFGRDDPEAAIIERLTTEVATRAPALSPWLPLIAIAFNLEIPPTPEIEMLAEANRRAKLHESVRAFLRIMLPETALIEIENAHHMDEASAAFLSYLTERIDSRPWLFAVARRPTSGGFTAPDAATVVRIELKPIAAADALRLTQIATKETPLPAHVLELVATRSGGNPQFLRDLLQIAIESGGTADLPDSAEAAAMAQIDGLAPEDRAVVRRAAVFGLTFHPRMLAWFADETEGPSPDSGVWIRLSELFEEEPDGYLRFRRSLLRDAAYSGLPFKLRRKLHSAVAAHLNEEMDFPEEAAGVLSLHHLEAGEYGDAWRHAKIAAQRAHDVYAYVEAAGFYGRALEAGKSIPELKAPELAEVHRSMGDAWYQAAQFRKAGDAYGAARPLVASDPFAEAVLLSKLSHVEGKLGRYSEARPLAEQARALFQKLSGPDAAKQAARTGAWYAIVLQAQGKTTEALDWAERTASEAEAVDDAEALGDAYFVKAWAHGELGKEGAQDLMQRSLEAYQRAGNVIRQTHVLSDIGVVCQWEGRWDEALSYYERARKASQEIGSTTTAALAQMNSAEILTDRGEWAEAEAQLQQTLPIWRTSQFRYFLAACLSLLGRVSLRSGRTDAALAQLQEARTNFLHVGAEEEVPAVDARIAECLIETGKPEAAQESIQSMLERADSSHGVSRILPLLQRVHGHALLRQDDLWGARDALEASLAAAKERKNFFEATLSMLSLIELDRLEGVEPALEMVDETRKVLANLKVRAVPPVPRPSR